MGEAERAITITRVFDAPRKAVWREWTEAERFADWFGGPESKVPLSSVSMDVRPEGEWRLTMFAQRGEIHWEGKYLEVAAPERLVFTVTDEPGADADAHVCTVVLVDLGDGRTEMRFEQRGPMPPEQVEAAGKGWQGFFDRIAERLAA
jgi:uncharacterized protein YndB with AHSA1/START domain